jgi:hypothetical protein
VNSLKWWISDSIERFISVRRGGATFWSCTITGPSGIWSRHWRMILSDSRTSSIRTR